MRGLALHGAGKARSSARRFREETGKPRGGGPKFDRYREPEAWNVFLSELVELALWFEDAGTAIGICRDADDDKFLALAVTGRADEIVSGDSDLLELGVHEGIPILSPAQFLKHSRGISA